MQASLKVKLYFIRSTNHAGYYLHPKGDREYEVCQGMIGAAVWTWPRGLNFLRQFPEYEGQLEMEAMPDNAKLKRNI